MEQILSVNVLYHLKILLVFLVFLLSLPVVKRELKRIARLWLRKGKYVEEALLMPNGSFKVDIYNYEYYCKKDLAVFTLKGSLLLTGSFYLSYVLSVGDVIPLLAIINTALLLALLKWEIKKQRRRLEMESVADFCKPYKR